MSLLQAIVLGIVQGLTEFLPISSTAHLLVVPWVFGWADPGAAFSAVIQCGTLLAVFVALRRDIAAIASGVIRGLFVGRPLANPNARIGILIVLGTLPIVAAGFTLREFVRGDARRIETVIGALVFTAVLMGAAELLALRRARRGSAGRDGLEAVGFVDGITMGFAQVLALVPGTSRSGVTIASGIFTGLDRRTAARFSFLLSLPAISAAALLEGWEQRAAIFGSREDTTAVLVGTTTAFAVGYATIRWLLSMLTRHTLWPFVIYRLLLAAALGALLQGGLAGEKPGEVVVSGPTSPAAKHQSPAA
jgi:undecaprenyl-diphosphatase